MFLDCKSSNTPTMVILVVIMSHAVPANRGKLRPQISYMYKLPKIRTLVELASSKQSANPLGQKHTLQRLTAAPCDKRQDRQKKAQFSYLLSDVVI